MAILVIIFLYILQNKNEHADTTTDNITAKTINASGDVNTAGNINTSGEMSTFGVGGKDKNKWVLYTPLGVDRTQMYFAPRKADNSDWDWNGSTSFEKNGNVNFSGGLTAKGNISTTGNINTSGEMSTFGVGGKNKWVLYTPLGVDRTQMYFAPRKADNSDWDWGGSTSFEKNGNVNFSGVLTAKKFVSADGSSSGPLSNEAIQSIASVYNKDNLTATNITATNNLDVVGNIGTKNNLNVAGNIDTKNNLTVAGDLYITGKLRSPTNNINLVSPTGRIFQLEVGDNPNTNGTILWYRSPGDGKWGSLATG